MKSKVKSLITRFWLLIFFILMYGFIWFFQISLADIWKTVTSLSFWQIGLLLGVYFLFSFFTILARQFLLYSLKSRCHFRNLLYIHFSSMAAHYTTPAKIGFPLAVFLLNRFENVPPSKGTAMILIELSVNMAISGGFALLGSLFFLADYQGSILKAILILMGIALVLMFVFWQVNHRSKSLKGLNFVRNVVESFKGISIWNVFGYVFIAVMLQVFGVLNLLLLTHFFADGISIFKAVAVSSTAFFLGAASMIPMGLGVREGTVIFFLKHLGIAENLGISIVTIQRLLSTGLTLIMGSIFGSILGIRNIISEQSSEEINR